MNVNSYLRKAYMKQFKTYYGRVPTDEQLNTYMDFFLRKNDDIKKVSDVCQIPFSESFSDRESFARHYKFIYGFDPSEEQLDMFISFSLCVVTDVWKVTKICNTGSIDEQKVPVNE